MALSTIEEERKRKEAAAKQLTPTTDPFLASIARGDYTTPKPVVKQAQATPGNIMSESFYGGADYSPRTRPQIGQSQPDGSRLVIDQRASTQSNTINPPPLKEIPNAQRDAELGKMTASRNGNIVTYDIGGNTLSYDASQTDPSKISLRNINKSSGNAPTWDDYHVQQRARYEAANPRKYASSESTPITPKPIEDNSFGGLFLQGLQTRKNMSEAQMADLRAKQEVARAEVMNQANRTLVDVDRNRLLEMDVQGQNKLRDIQGQVAQQPPVTESTLKPMIIEEADPNDPTGMSKRQRIMIPNAEGTGYVDGMTGQAPASTVPQVTPEQRSKINALIKANPNIDRATILQKIANGEI